MDARHAWLALVVVVLCLGCGDDDGTDTDTARDAGSRDASTMADGGPADSAVPDAAITDAAVDDSSTPQDAAAESDAGMCPTGMAGPTCTDCAPGYQDADGDGACLLGCDATGPDALDCGAGGACAVAAGERACECVAGYELMGGACVLDLPPATNLVVWLDADADASFALSGNAVAAWSDRRPAGSPTLSQGTGSARPARVNAERNGRDVVRFDGGDQLFVNSFFGLSTADYEVIVAAGPVAGATGLVSTASGTTNWGVMLDSVGSGYRLTHRAPAASAGGLTLDVNRTGAIGPGWVSASVISSSSPDTMALFASDGSGTVSNASFVTTSGVGDGLTLRVGRSQAGFFAGDVYEVLIYTRRLAVSERAEVTDYLRAKWAL